HDSDDDEDDDDDEGPSAGSNQGSGLSSERTTREEAKTSSLQSRKDYTSGGSFEV
ncbi:hypothetical protein Tco_0342568, partial [Tanacetum coccineum]